ncbi:MAG: asnB, partial [Mycobacterium sp.]|nr:asnB [Mycobacterium sp.]
MSGLAGIRPAAGAEGTPLAPVAAALAHRGPAGQLDLDLDAGVRLSVRYREGERVTARTGDGVVAVLDGELYATTVLAEELAAAGHPVPADADAPALALAAYTAFGLGGLGRLDGAFALVVHDGRDGATHLAVDRAGAGALYRVTTADGGTLYASEPTALLAAEGVAAGPDDAVVRHFLRTGVSDTGEATFFAGISRVVAGQVVTLTDAGARATAYPVPDPTAATDVASVVDAAVAVRAAGDRVVTRLSHGLAGTVLAARVQAAEVVVGNYPPYGDGESGATAKALAALGTGARTVDVDPGDHLAEFVRAVGEPVGDLATYALYAITGSVDADALLAADGADALLATAAPRSKKPVEVSALLVGQNGTVADPRDRQAAGVATALRVADRAG